MISKSIKIEFLLLALLITKNSLSGKDEDVVVQNRQATISKRYLKKFPEKVITAADMAANLQDEQKKMLAFLFKIQKVEMPDTDIEKVAHNIIANQAQKKYSKNNSIISLQAIEKLNVFQAEHSLLSELTTSSSFLGKNALLYELSDPTTLVDALLEKQQIIKTIGETATLKTILVNTSSLETSILNFWNNKPMLPKYIEDGIYFGGPFARFFNINKLVEPFNRYPILLELKSPGLGTLFTLIQAIIAPELINKYGPSAISENTDFQAVLKMPYATRVKMVSEMTKNALNSGFFLYKWLFNNYPKATAAGTAYISLGLYQVIVQTYNIENWFAHMQKHFIDLATYLEHTRNIVRCFKENNLYYPLAFPELEHLIDLDNKAKHSADFNQLVDLLKTSTFKGTASKLSYLGRVKCAYKLFMNVRQEFEPILYAMAKLQMYNGVAQLMTSSANKQNRFCFAEFVDYGPYVEAVDFWNPMVGQETAVSNSLFMTPSEKDIILHGPNTGGKTTTIKGLIYNILLAQTLGIGAAQQLILSPFAQINCFMDIQDDVSQGFSLFDAEVRFATELHNSVHQLQENEYAFTIADEILRSTSPSKGQACAYQFTKKLAKNPNSMSITVTHYPKLVELSNETPNNGFRTFHVEIIRNANGKVIRTYKLKLGATTENIAGDILQEHGIFDASDLAEVERLEEEFKN
ncbi:hypothetical protein EKK58_06685 [Candidatus Dependentiae bacterium]|nr:MAG: hypothetical protein EKK58_06685 [Candidatus Dependentiae bacterium]